jgi:hypothetical protein
MCRLDYWRSLLSCTINADTRVPAPDLDVAVVAVRIGAV